MECYVSWVIRLSRHFHRSPDTLSQEEVRDYLRTLHEAELGGSTINQAVHALRYFFLNILDWPEDCLVDCLPATRAPKRQLRAYSIEHVGALLEAARPILYQYTFLSLLYHSGLRLGEACSLEFTQIERSSRRIFVSQGKGRKDRYTILPDRLQSELVDYYRRVRREWGKELPWVFLGPNNPIKPLNPGTPQRFFHRVRRKAGLPNIGGIHVLRHCFASHQLMCGMDIVQLRRLMGHKSLQTTMRYLRLLEDQAGYDASTSPLDRKEGED
jgi:site-specific recombinase XerD